MISTEKYNILKEVFIPSNISHLTTPTRFTFLTKAQAVKIVELLRSNKHLDDNTDYRVVSVETTNKWLYNFNKFYKEGSKGTSFFKLWTEYESKLGLKQ